MKKILAMLLVLCMCLSVFGTMMSALPKVAAVSSNVRMIVTNPAENSSTAMNIGFHVPLGYTSCYVQYTTTDDTSWAKAKTNNGSYNTYGASSSTNPFYGQAAVSDTGSEITQSVTFLDYNVNLTGLTPDTNYMYRIYDGSAYSNTYYFKTAANDGSNWSFLVTGDFHEYFKNYSVHRAAQATKAINAGVSLAGQLGWEPVEHIVSVGDIVAWGVDYGQWQNVLDQSWAKNYSFANCIGNHDDMNKAGTSSSSAYNSVIFNHPLNGYNSGYEMGTVFYYVYNNVLFIYVNYLKASAAAQETWAQSVVDNLKGSYKYITLVNHRPATSKYNGKTYSYFWNYWADFCDKNKVDLVLAGDHHVYMRSQPIYNGAMLSGYSASNPDATVYIAADSSDGERGSSTDVSTFNSSWVASNYYRYNYSGSKKDKTSIIINVTPTKMTTQFVYYEDISSASHPSWKQGSVTGHSSFYYGDVSYVYPSDHSYQPSDGTEDESGLPAASKNFFSAANGGTYMYPTTNYPGGSSYYTYEYYGDNGTQGGSYMTGKLNDGVIPDDASPSGEKRWSVIFNSNGTPEIYLKLSEKAYLNNISVIYRYTGYYSDLTLSSMGLSTTGSSYTNTAAYSASKQVYSGNNYKLTFTFDSVVEAQYIKLSFGGPSTDATRYAFGEIQVWGDTVLPDIGKFELIEGSDYTLDDTYVTLSDIGHTAETVAGQFACDVTVLDSQSKSVASTIKVGTGYVVVKYNAAGEVKNSATVIVRGDIDGDADITNTDYLGLKSRLKTFFELDNCYNIACDYDGDGDATAADLLSMKRYIAS